MKKMLLIAICGMLYYSLCAADIKPEFYVNNKGAKMPVVIRGNIKSRALIIFLHGGPGGTAMKKIGTRAFNDLEAEFGIVYWDQRGSDASHGGTKKKYMNLAQFVEDLDLLIELLRLRYPQSRLFLMGHCWGGGYGTAYLTDSMRQLKISGWIEVAGAHNNPLGDSLSAVWVKNQALRKINAGEKKIYWRRAMKWYEQKPDFESNALGHYSFVRKLNGYQYAQGDSLGKFPGYSPSDLFKSPIKFISYYVNYFQTLNKFIISDIDLTNQMGNIRIPTLILWGMEDGLIPLALGYEAYDALGTPEEFKKLVTLENTGHTIYYEQPTRFVHEVKSFVNLQLSQHDFTMGITYLK